MAEQSESAIQRHLREAMVPQALVVIGFLTALSAVVVGPASPMPIESVAGGAAFGIAFMAIGYWLLPGETDD